MAAAPQASKDATPANAPKVADLFALLDDFSMGFEIIEPLRSRDGA